eukprot:Skav221104  [mRNA]  locus=scaffold693:298165:302673:- [translate_table: standard]
MGYASEVLNLGQTTTKSLFRMKELCAGIGGLSTGARFAGVKTTAIVEKQPKFCNLHPKGGPVAVIEGDISRLSTISRLFRAAPEVDSLGLGFSCQPFSKGGDRRGGYDTRAYTLAWGLFCAFILKAPVIVLECVSEAPDHQYVRQCIHAFQQCTGFHATERVLDISSFWPSSRKRWWCILTHLAVGKVNLSPMPRLPQQPIVSDIFPEFAELDEEELANLTLQPYEREALQKLGTDLSRCEAPLHGVMPTALHSWGNQLGPCACECRPFALSTQRLLDRGFFGTLVRYRTSEGGWSFRHPAPSEVAILVGMPLRFNTHKEPRLELCALGQIASPFQSAWIYGIIKEHVLAQGVTFMPRELTHAPLRRVVEAMLEVRDSMFPPAQHSTAMSRFTDNIRALLEVPEQVQGEPPSEAPAAGHDGPRTDFVWPARIEHVDVTPCNTAPSMVGAVPGFQWQSLPVQEDGPSNEVNTAEPLGSQDSDGRFAACLLQDTQWQAAEHTNSTETEATPEVPHPNATSKQDEPVTAVSSVDPEVTQEAGPDAASQDSAQEQTQHDQATAEEVASPSTPAQEDAEMTEAVPSEGEGDPDAASQDSTSPSPRDDHGMHTSSDGDTMTHIPGTWVTPHEIMTKGTVIFNRVHDFVCAIQVADDATIAELIHAEFGTDSGMTAWSVVGQQLSEVDLVANWQVVVLQHHLDKTQDQNNMVDFLQPHGCRGRSLMIQGTQVAHDEMAYYLSALGSEQCKVVMPLIVPMMVDPEQEFQLWFQQFSGEETGTNRVSAILSRGHWSPVLQTGDGNLHTTVEGGAVLANMGINNAQTHEMEAVFEHDCGFQTFAWLSYHLGRSPHLLMAIDVAASWRFLFWQHVSLTQSQNMHPLLALGGHKEELQVALTSLLREHGVPMEEVVRRTDQVLDRIGREKLTQAFQSKRPWAQIKQLANGCQPKLQLVLPSELEQVLKHKTSTNRSVGSKDNKLRAGPPVSQAVHANDILVPPGVFVYPDGKPTHQIELRQIQSIGKGLVVCSEQDVQPFLQAAPLTQEGLAFLIVNPTSEFQSQRGNATRVPAQCRSTGEPMLISVVILQAGATPVARNLPQVMTKVQEIQVSTVKAFIYHDQVESWTEVIASPVRYVLNHLPWLASCRKKDCKCPAWHRSSSTEETNETEPILDIWGRDYLSNAFRKTKPRDAEMFVFSMRIRGDLLEKLMASSGHHGLYFEPRSDDGRNSHEGFLTVWLQKLDFAEACAAMAKSSKKAYLIRVAKRYGLKVATSDAPSVHQQFRGDAPFLGTGQSAVYQLGPLPWGTSRQALQKLFGSWGWPAVPLQPAGKSACQRGLLWWARANAPPSHSVVTMSHGDLIIVKRDADTAPRPKIERIEASTRTKHSLTGQPSFTKDMEDPWAAAASKLPTAQVITQSHLDQLESRLLQKMTQSPSSEDDAMTGGWEPRVKQLEEQMATLASAQQQQAAQTQSLEHKLEAQTKAFQHHLDQSMAQQMDKIEQLLAKRKWNE